MGDAARCSQTRISPRCSLHLAAFRYSPWTIQRRFRARSRRPRVDARVPEPGAAVELLSGRLDQQTCYGSPGRHTVSNVDGSPAASTAGMRNDRRKTTSRSSGGASFLSLARRRNAAHWATFTASVAKWSESPTGSSCGSARFALLLHGYQRFPHGCGRAKDRI